MRLNARCHSALAHCVIICVGGHNDARSSSCHTCAQRASEEARMPRNLKYSERRAKTHERARAARMAVSITAEHTHTLVFVCVWVPTQRGHKMCERTTRRKGWPRTRVVSRWHLQRCDLLATRVHGAVVHTGARNSGRSAAANKETNSLVVG